MSRIKHKEDKLMSKTICCLAFFVGFTNSLVGEQPIYVTTWGESGTGNGQFQGLHDAALDPNGNIYVTDWINHRIQQVWWFMDRAVAWSLRPALKSSYTGS